MSPPKGLNRLEVQASLGAGTTPPMAKALKDISENQDTRSTNPNLDRSERPCVCVCVRACVCVHDSGCKVCDGDDTGCERGVCVCVCVMVTVTLI